MPDPKTTMLAGLEQFRADIAAAVERFKASVGAAPIEEGTIETLVAMSAASIALFGEVSRAYDIAKSVCTSLDRARSLLGQPTTPEEVARGVRCDCPECRRLLAKERERNARMH